MTPFQFDEPVFVRDRYNPITMKGKVYRYNDHFPWRELGLDEDRALALYNADRIYHNESLIETTHLVAPSLLTPTNLETLVNLLNAEIKKKTTSVNQYNKKKVKQSKIREKQLGLLKTWRAHNQKWSDMAEMYDTKLKELYESQDK